MVVVVAALGAPWLAAFDPIEQDIGEPAEAAGMARRRRPRRTPSAPTTSAATCWPA